MAIVMKMSESGSTQPLFTQLLLLYMIKAFSHWFIKDTGFSNRGMLTCKAWKGLLYYSAAGVKHCAYNQQKNSKHTYGKKANKHWSKSVAFGNHKVFRSRLIFLVSVVTLIIWWVDTNWETPASFLFYFYRIRRSQANLNHLRVVLQG